MKQILNVLVLASALVCGLAAAADSTCDSQAADKKLSGAAKTSFVKKCERDSSAASAQTTCAAQAADKKLAGAAKNSYVKKCVSDASK